MYSLLFVDRGAAACGREFLCGKGGASTLMEIVLYHIVLSQ